MLDIASPSTSRLLVGGWAVAAVIWAGLMYVMPGQETVPFHLIWIGLALVYGFTRWTPLAMVTALLLVTVTTGLILVHHAAAGAIRWEETTEEPLMAGLIAVMVWHVHRRNQALAQVRRFAEAEHRRLEVQQRFVRLASHELRTPITVARGYTEMVRAAHRDDPRTAEDTSIVLDELDKLARITQRLVMLMQIETPHPVRPVDLDRELLRILHRWEPAADRQWSVRSHVGQVTVNAERLEAAIDCLVENAVKFTGPGDRIDLVGRRDGGAWTVEVRDTGSGMSHETVASLLNGPPRRTATGTGLGLAIVRAVADGLDGRVLIASEPDVGTAVTLSIPHTRHFEPLDAGPADPVPAPIEVNLSPMAGAGGGAG
jgi:two-component system, OmpR family, sensor kinase